MATKRIAVIATIYRYLSHAQHFADRFLVGYPYGGRWHRPDCKIVSLYVDQQPEGDQSQDRAREFGFAVYPHHRRGPALRRRRAGLRRRPDHR